jgi:hypothetical protein
MPGAIFYVKAAATSIDSAKEGVDFALPSQQDGPKYLHSRESRASCRSRDEEIR